jgi:hypothetical protein
VKKRSIVVYVQLAMCGCEAAHGPYGGSVERQTLRAVMFLGSRSFQRDRSVNGSENLKKKGGTYRARKYAFQIRRVKSTSSNHITV